jgi:hypothetical protein
MHRIENLPMVPRVPATVGQWRLEVLQADPVRMNGSPLERMGQIISSDII